VAGGSYETRGHMRFGPLGPPKNYEMFGTGGIHLAGGRRRGGAGGMVVVAAMLPLLRTLVAIV
jgi:hypothetical protein